MFDLRRAQQGGTNSSCLLPLPGGSTAEGIKAIAAGIENLPLHHYHGVMVLASSSLPRPPSQSSQESSGNFVLLFLIMPLPRQ